jgi:hypothetical protein
MDICIQIKKINCCHKQLVLLGLMATPEETFGDRLFNKFINQFDIKNKKQKISNFSLAISVQVSQRKKMIQC